MAGQLVADAIAKAGVEPPLAHDEDASTGSVVVAGTGVVADPYASARLAPDDLPLTLEAGAVLVAGYSLLQPGAEAAAALDVADTVGAGDAFSGGFLLALARGGVPGAALRAGCDAGAAAIGANSV